MSRAQAIGPPGLMTADAKAIRSAAALALPCVTSRSERAAGFGQRQPSWTLNCALRVRGHMLPILVDCRSDGAVAFPNLDHEFLLALMCGGGASPAASIASDQPGDPQREARAQVLECGRAALWA